MAVSRQEVLQVAQLARLRLTPEEVDRFTAQLSGILDHIEVLSAIDVTGVEAVDGMTEASAPLRSDELAADALLSPVSAIAPGWEDGFFTVPRVAALDTSDLEEPFEDKARIESSGRPDAEDLNGGAA